MNHKKQISNKTSIALMNRCNSTTVASKDDTQLDTKDEINLSTTVQQHITVPPTQSSDCLITSYLLSRKN